MKKKLNQKLKWWYESPEKEYNAWIKKCKEIEKNDEKIIEQIEEERRTKWLIEKSLTTTVKAKEYSEDTLKIQKQLT